MATKEFQINDFPPEIFEELIQRISNFTVGFVKVLDQHPHHEALLSGSGTLVSINGRHGILTAHHVIAELPTHGPVGLVLSTDLHRYTIDAERASLIRLDRGQNDERGPDLGFVELAAPDVKNISAQKSFCNVTLSGERLAKKQPEILEGVWAIVGFIDEATKEEPGQAGFSGIRAFKCFVGFGGVEPPYSEGQYDYYEMRVSHNDSSNNPKDFGGMSGGGLWQAVLHVNSEEKFRVDELYLSGVPFYQVELNNNESVIRCHGRKSVHRRVPELLEKHS